MSDSTPNLDHICDDLKPLAIPMDAIDLMDGNPRDHDDKSIQAIAASLKIFKQTKPIVLSADGRVIIAGNGTYQAAKLLGWTHIAANKSHLEGEEALAYAIADNRTAELSQFDYDIVGAAMKGMSDSMQSNLGFSDDEIKSILEGNGLDGGASETELKGEEPDAMGDVEYRVLVMLDNADDQSELIARLEDEGYTCQPLMS